MGTHRRSRREVVWFVGLALALAAIPLGCQGTAAAVRAEPARRGAAPAATRDRAGTSDPEDRGEPYILADLVNLVSDDLSDNTGADGPDRRADRIVGRLGKSRVDIKDPDPDSAGFPNSAFTLPEGRAYVEVSPLSYYAPNRNNNLRYSTEFLLRYGLTDSLEFRIFSSGLSYVKAPPAAANARGGGTSTTGFAPLTFDLKAHLWDENRKYGVPATALEVYLQTDIGSPAFNEGTQPSVTLNFDNTLPWDLVFEWNVGISGNRSTAGRTYYQYAFQWSLQRNLIGNFDVYAQGFVNDSALPRLNEVLAPGAVAEAAIVVGAGGIWTVTKRFAIFGSYNFGVTAQAPPNIALLGGAMAF